MVGPRVAARSSRYAGSARALGKGEVLSSILSGSTSFCEESLTFSERRTVAEPHAPAERRKNMQAIWHVFDTRRSVIVHGRAARHGNAPVMMTALRPSGVTGSGVGAVGKWPVAMTATSPAAAGHLSTDARPARH